MTKEINIEWIKCPHGIEKRSMIPCMECQKIKNEYFAKAINHKDESPKKIPILRGCHASKQGGCFCNGSCKEIIGYRESLYVGEK